MQSYGAAQERVVKDVKALLADTEDLLRAVGSESKGEIAALRPRVEQAVAHVRAQLREIEHRAVAAAREADAYAHDNPWTTAGVAAGLGAALGAILGVLLSRR